MMGVGVALTLAGCSQIPGAKQVQQQVEQKVSEGAQKVATNILTEQELSGITDPLVRKHLVAQASQTSYRVTNLPSGSNQETVVTEIQMKGTDFGFHTYTDTNGQKSREMIMLGDTTYVKDPSDNAWWKQSKQPDASGNPSMFGFSLPKLSDVKDDFVKKQTTATFKQLGSESCGKAAPTLTCYKYEETDSDNSTASRTFWFDNQQYLLRQEQRGSGMLTTYDYDNVNITAPAPTKDVPEGQSIYMYLLGNPAKSPVGTPTGKKVPVGMPSQADLQKLMDQAKQYQQP